MSGASWQEQLRQASFRGVPFSVSSAEAGFGRRTVTHEYPLRDRPFVEDLGRKARTLTVEALVLGTGYMALRDRLLAALEAPGPGTLVHPYLGEMTVTVTDVKLRESTAEGGVARFTLSCVEAGEMTYATSAANAAQAVSAAGEAVTRAATAQFVRTYATQDKPAFLASAAGALLQKGLGAMREATGLVRSTAARVAALTRDIRTVTQSVLDVAYVPAMAAQALVSNLQQLVREVTTVPRESLQLAQLFFTFGDGLTGLIGGTTSRQQLAANQHAMVQLVRATAVAEAAQAASAVAFTSVEDAVAVRNELVEVMDALMLGGADDDLYDALRTLRSATVRDINARGADLAHLVKFTPHQTLPALVIAHQLYADATRADEIVARNGIAHPGFVAGARVLEVVADV